MTAALIILVATTIALAIVLIGFTKASVDRKSREYQAGYADAKEKYEKNALSDKEKAELTQFLNLMMYSGSEKREGESK